ncbi:MAG: SAM-dependent methyltransferase [Bacteroidia bacterium]
MAKGKLFLIPSLLGETKVTLSLPQQVIETVSQIEYFIVENEKSARHFLKKVNPLVSQPQLKIFELDKHDLTSGITGMLLHAIEGKNIGLISEAGCPAVADPGADVISKAHELKIKVVPLTGPSSILLALMASGLNGQQFCFHGYLPIEKNERSQKIKQLEKESFQKQQTQIFIETPYRNMQLLESIIQSCEGKTLLCIATDISLDSERIYTMSVKEWVKAKPEINKRPTVFLLLKK